MSPPGEGSGWLVARPVFHRCYRRGGWGWGGWRRHLSVQASGLSGEGGGWVGRCAWTKRGDQGRREPS